MYRDEKNGSLSGTVLLEPDKVRLVVRGVVRVSCDEIVEGLAPQPSEVRVRWLFKRYLPNADNLFLRLIGSTSNAAGDKTRPSAC